MRWVIITNFGGMLHISPKKQNMNTKFYKVKNLSSKSTAKIKKNTFLGLPVTLKPLEGGFVTLKFCFVRTLFQKECVGRSKESSALAGLERAVWGYHVPEVILYVDCGRYGKAATQWRKNKMGPHSAPRVLIQFVTFPTTLSWSTRALFLKECMHLSWPSLWTWNSMFPKAR